MHKRVLALAGMALLWLGAPALAILPAPAPTDTVESPSSSQPLSETRDPAADERVETRIRQIFAEVPSLAGVEVAVSEGVVKLTGVAPDQAAIDRAQAITERFDIATVENTIERDTSVDSGIGALQSLQDRVGGWAQSLPLVGVALLVALAIGALGYLLAGLSGFWRRVMPNPFLAELVASALRFGFAIIGVVIALDMLGASALLGAVLGGAGVIGIALGFAMRETIENYVASLMLSLRQPFRANDHVVIDAHEGRVIRLTSRATVLMTLDGNHLRIPNGQVFKAVILNYTTNPQRRFDFDLGIDADDDPDAARHLGRETLKALDFVLDEPPPEARAIEVGDSNILIRYLGWIDQRETDFFKAKSRAIAAVKRALEDGGFGLPEPIYRLRFDQRSEPLPLQNVAVIEGTGQPKPGTAKPSTPVAEDVAPQDEIRQMVDRERRSAGEQHERDLLDHARPVE